MKAPVRHECALPESRLERLAPAIATHAAHLDRLPLETAAPSPLEGRPGLAFKGEQCRCRAYGGADRLAWNGEGEFSSGRSLHGRPSQLILTGLDSVTGTVVAGVVGLFGLGKAFDDPSAGSAEEV